MMKTGVLERAHFLTEDAAQKGFKWPSASLILNKVREEVDELAFELKEQNQEKLVEEFGDLLFALVSLAQFCGFTPEQALHLANEKFSSRFNLVQELAASKKIDLHDCTIEELESLWRIAKSQ